MKHNQKAFSVVFILLAILVVSALSFAGWRVLKNRQTDSKKVSDSSQNTTVDESTLDNTSDIEEVSNSLDTADLDKDLDTTELDQDLDAIL